MRVCKLFYCCAIFSTAANLICNQKADVCNEDEWDRFEWLCMYERFAYRKPDDPGLPALIAQLHSWRDIYLYWGRDTLEFGLYLFQK